MDESRQQAYLYLIQELLRCPHGSEQAILNDNRDLLDAGLVQMMKQMAEALAKSDRSTAERLINLARQLAEVLGLSSPTSTASPVPNSNAQLRFLVQILQATAESEGDARGIYPLLVENTAYLNLTLAEVLRHWAITTLPERQPDEAQYIAVVIAGFSNLIGQFPLGNKANNMEIAIAGYEGVLTVFTRDAFPQQWAMMQHNLGAAYFDRIVGDKRENLELAIAYCSAALEVYTRDAFPQEWAMTQNNLGNVYSKRIVGNKRENLELAIACFSAALEVYTRDAFPQQWAMTQHNLGLAYGSRIVGDKQENLELVIAYCSAALEVLTRDAFPQQWAMTQDILGLAYSDRIKGDKQENLELAIASCSAALQVLTRDAFPQKWAMTKNNLGNAYLDRIKGDKRENLELAIAYCSAALQVYTRDAFPQDWAGTQYNLGAAYLDRIKGDKRENLELAIASFSAALQVYTRDAFPQEWAGTQNGLGNAYSNRIVGDKRENLELAIKAYTAALQVRTPDAFPQDWAMTQLNLGVTYFDRIMGDKALNLELAIKAYTAALQVYTRDTFPQEWATTQNNLGNAYHNRIQGDKQESVELAIAAYTAALQVLTRDAFPQQWATTQFNLGNAYTKRIKGDKRENLELAIAYCTAALQVLTRDTFPQDWAKTQNNLGNAYLDRIKGDKRENLELAIACFSAALEVYTRDAFPQNHAQTLFNLGIAYQNAQQFIEAYTTFNRAIETVDLLRVEIVSGDESKRKQAEEWSVLYCRMVEVCLELDKITEAIEYAERSKTRNLVELILDRDLKTIFPSEVVTQLEQLRDEIASGQYQLQNGKAENPTALAQYLQQLRQQRNDLQNRYLPIGSGFKLDQLQASLDEHTTVVEWYITLTGFESFIITRNRLQRLNISNPTEQNDAVLSWFLDYINAYSQTKDEWQISLASRLSRLAEILHLEDILTLVPKTCSRLILIPHRYLHLFPIQALPLSHNGKKACLLDRFPNGVSYAPSCQLLLQAQQRKRPNFKHLFAIQNPTNDLAYTDLEVQAITDYFNPVNILKHKTATLTAINEANLNAIHCAHFSCHGYFNERNARKSALIPADVQLNPPPTQLDPEHHLPAKDGKVFNLDKCLTLDAILGLNLEQCRLVTLSACETGLIDFFNTSDEYIGLPSGFLVAGSPNVVSSLWRVDDIASALLMIKFYQNLQTNSTVAIALNQAQIWLRDATKEELQDWTEQLSLTPTQEECILDYLDDLNSTAKPFQSPYYWAAFCAIGQ